MGELKLTTRMQMAMERAWTDREGVTRIDNSTLMKTRQGLQARGLVFEYSHVLTAKGLAWRAASQAEDLIEQTREEVASGSHPRRGAEEPTTKRVQHSEIKQGMTIKLADHGPQGRWARIDHVVEQRADSRYSAASALVIVTYTGGRDAGTSQRIFLYERKGGYAVHPDSEISAAQLHQRKGRADFVKNVILREYSLKLAIVDRVDNQGEVCGYCTTNLITTNISATVNTESGRTEESAWSTCTPCTVYSIDKVEDVDPAHTITIERA